MNHGSEIAAILQPVSSPARWFVIDLLDGG